MAGIASIVGSPGVVRFKRDGGGLFMAQKTVVKSTRGMRYLRCRIGGGYGHGLGFSGGLMAGGTGVVGAPGVFRFKRAGGGLLMAQKTVIKPLKGMGYGGGQFRSGCRDRLGYRRREMAGGTGVIGAPGMFRTQRAGLRLAVAEKAVIKPLKLMRYGRGRFG